MHTTHDAVIRASAQSIFALAADVERWPKMHPAYRWCRVLERDADAVVFEMGGRIRGWPARWTARQERYPTEGRIVFHHLAGITRGMVVEWRLEPVRDGTRVSILHDLVMAWPLVGRLVSDIIVGPIFIDWIARRTLQGVRHELETG
ncbi:MAG: type II toxin-antitoxin system RatA family toxin [Gemmatimonadales bacterium]